jgi:hypothetical protein
MTEQTETTQSQPESPTKAYSDLYNTHKAFVKDAESARAKLEGEIAELRKQVQTVTDTGKNPEDLMNELTEVRKSFDSTKAELDKMRESTNSLIEASMKDLTAEQKELVEYSSDDPFKKLNFINNLRGSKVIRSSQGGGITDEGEVHLDIQRIANEADRGNLEPLKAAYKQYGKERVQKIIQEKTTRSVARA